MNRRGFIKRIGLGIGLLALATTRKPEIKPERLLYGSDADSVPNYKLPTYRVKNPRVLVTATAYDDTKGRHTLEFQAISEDGINDTWIRGFDIDLKKGECIEVFSMDKKVESCSCRFASSNPEMNKLALTIHRIAPFT